MKSDICPACEGDEMEQAYADHADCCPVFMEQMTVIAECAANGHQFADVGWGGPESGCIHVECEVCGFSYPTVWLY